MDKMTNAKALAWVLANATLPEDVEEKIVAMKASLDKKSANRKPTKAQKENEDVKEVILSALTVEGATVTEIQARAEELGGLSNQKISALLRQLVEEGKAVKTTDKKKSYFSIA